MIVPVQPEDYAIYQAVLLQRFSNSRRERFVIQKALRSWALELSSEEKVSSCVLYWRLKLTGLEAATADDFVRKNSEESCMDQKLGLPLPCSLIAEQEVTETWSRPDGQSLNGQPLDGWKVFRERYPNAGGLIRFSRIGFNEQKSQALLEVGIQADWLMGHGELLLLSKSKEGWKVGNELALWIS